MKKFIITILLILILITAAVGYWYYRGRMFSKEVLKLEIIGPQSVEAGDEIEYTLRYRNNGDFTLENVSLTFEFPEYSLVEGNRRITKSLNDIYPGQENTKSFKARLLGEEGDLKEAEARLSYTPKNLRARYESQTTFTTEIDFVPLALDFDLPSRIESEKEVQFPLNYYSNMNTELEDVEIEIEYPESFQFLESSPEGIEDTVWKISTLKKTDGGRKILKGILEGEPGDKKEFKARIGLWQNGEFILLKETTKEIEIVKPSLYITQEINGESDYIASPGEELEFDVYFKNVGNSPFENEFLMIRLKGEAFNLETIEADLGEAQTGDNLIIWDWRRVPELRYLDSEEEGKVSFSVELKENWDVEEPGETVVINRVNLSQVHREFETKVNSKLVINQRGYYENEFFDELGPIPPQVGEETSYVIVWEVNNLYNDTENVKVRSVLPENVNLTGEIYPREESPRFSFDSLSREIVWIVSENTLEAGETSLIAFQVLLTPEEEQRGEKAEIIGEALVRGEDNWTERELENIAEKIDTGLIEDQREIVK